MTRISEIRDGFVEYNRLNDRIVYLWYFAVVIWFFLIAKTFYIQVYMGEYYRNRAINQSTGRNVSQAPRGKIYDRNGKSLALNGNIKLKYDKVKTREGTRLYPYGSYAAQVVGAVSKDGFGNSGLELSFDEILAGVDGYRFIRKNVNRQYYPGMDIDGADPIPGADLILTLDMEIQSIIETALEKGVKNLEAKKAAAIMIDPHTGEILGMASYPGFNPNYLDQTKKEYIRNDLINMVYEPGSIFKLITAAAALEEKSLTLDDKITGDNGRYKTQGGQYILDHSVHEVMTPYEAMAYSSNVAFAKIADKLGSKEFYKYLRAFGFGTPSGIRLPGEESGQVKPINKWSGRTLVTMAMGHEIMVTPLQMAMAYAAIANGGELLMPRIIKETINPIDGNSIVKVEKQVVRRVVSEETASIARELLKSVVDYGTARNIKSSWIEYSGKTGTAEKFLATEQKYSKMLNMSSFIGMVPAHDPHFVCMVVIDEPTVHRTASYTAAPIFKEIIENVYQSPVLAPLTSRVIYRKNNAEIEVDLFVGKTLTEIKNLKGSIRHPISIDGDNGLVVTQSVAAGAKISSSDTVNLKVADVEYGVMPDLKGLSVKDAMTLLEPMGSKVSFVGRGRVLSQSPNAGEEIKYNQVCELELGENL